MGWGKTEASGQLTSYYNDLISKVRNRADLRGLVTVSLGSSGQIPDIF